MLATTLSVVAIVIAIANFTYTQWRSDRREVDKWRRDELWRTTSELMQLSLQRQGDLSALADAILERQGSDKPYPELKTDPHSSVVAMEIMVERLRLIDGKIAEVASSVVHAHHTAIREAEGVHPNDFYGEIEALMVPSAELRSVHSDLQEAFRRRVKLSRLARSSKP